MGQYYDTATPEGALLWDLAQHRKVELPGTADLLSRYGERTLPVLEAAHVKPYLLGGPHDLANGILLRSDFHKLFDIGLVTISPDLRVEVSPRIKEEWFNGKAYYRLHGQRLANLPARAEDYPSSEFLAWHNERFHA